MMMFYRKGQRESSVKVKTMSRKKKRQVSKGSGKRYTSNKPKPPTAPVRRTPPPASYDEKALRNRISQFALSERFGEHFEKAFEQYMGPESIQRQGDKKILFLDEDETAFLGFQEWFYFDYVLGSGDRIIDLFKKEVGPQLSAPQGLILDDWLATNRLRLLETQSVEPGIGETMQDLLSGEILNLNDISFSYFGIRWSIFLARPILTEGRWHFTGSGIVLTPFEKPHILEVANELWAAYQQRHPRANLLDFYRDHSFDLYRAAQEILIERQKPQALFTEERHPVVFARAEFTLSGNPLEVERALDEAEEFEFVGENEDEFPDCLQYLWLLRGRSSVPKAQALDKGLIHSGSWTAGPGEPDFTTLGDLFLCWENLTLSCLSRERLQAGKQLLRKILGRRIRHRQDRFEGYQERMEREAWYADDEDYDERYTATSMEPLDEDWEKESAIIGEELRERYTRRWLDTQNKQGLTPRQMAQTPEGRAKLREEMKLLEFLEDRALKSGKKPPMHLDIIREELGL